MKYQVLHDQGLIMCFVGNTFHNHTLYEYFKQQRPCEQITVEDATSKSPAWFDQRQIMCAVTNIGFKKQVIDQLTPQAPNWFSVLADNSHIGHGVSIGHNTFVNNFNVVFDDAVIGNHCTITNYTQLSHAVVVGDFSHVGPYSYLSFTNLGPGSCLGLRSSFTGKPNNAIDTADWCNFMIGSVVTKSIASSGTYMGNRRISSNTSLAHKIL